MESVFRQPKRVHRVFMMPKNFYRKKPDPEDNRTTAELAESLEEEAAAAACWRCTAVVFAVLTVLLLAFMIFALVVFYGGNTAETIETKWSYLTFDWAEESSDEYSEES